MNKSIFWILGIVLVLVLAVVAWFVFGGNLQTNTANPNSATSTQTGFPISSNGSSSTQASGMTIKLQGGVPVQVKDFIHNNQTIPDVENTGSYLLAGSLGYCLPNMKCKAGSSSDFNISYDSSANSFGIALLKEPIGQVRQEAEQYLMNTLGLTQQQMCNLNYYVGTTYDVNENYDSSNLGFSFCPGAVKLP